MCQDASFIKNFFFRKNRWQLRFISRKSIQVSWPIKTFILITREFILLDDESATKRIFDQSSKRREEDGRRSKVPSRFLEFRIGTLRYL